MPMRLYAATFESHAPPRQYLFCFMKDAAVLAPRSTDSFRRRMQLPPREMPAAAERRLQPPPASPVTPELMFRQIAEMIFRPLRSGQDTAKAFQPPELRRAE